MLEERSDYELITDYLEGNDSAFEQLYQRHRKRLYGYLNGMMPWSPAEVDDVFQQTWVRAVTRLPKYRDQGYFAAWLFRIGRNLLIDKVRRSKRENGFLELDREETPEIDAPPGTEPWCQLDEAELGRLIQQALAELPEEQREVFLLRREKVAFKDIAEIQNCSINTVLSRMQYALKNLRTHLGTVDHGGLLQ